MPQRKHLLNIQRAFYERLQNYADRFLGQLNPKIKRYLTEYQRNYARFQRVSSKAELIKEVLASSLVVCGDYHTLSQAQRTVLRLLREVAAMAKKQNRPLILALEAIQAGTEAALDQFVRGEMTESKLKEAIGFHENWGFSWDSYSEFLRYAKAQKMRIVGINTVATGKRSLEKRDAFAADLLVSLTKAEPAALVFVLIGDLHLASTRLPKQISNALKKHRLKRKTLVVLQNEERFFWKLAAQGLEQKVDVVKVKDGVYCVLSTPPWVKLRSQIDWAFTKKESQPNVPDWSEEIDYSDEVVEFLEAIGNYFGFSKKLPNNYQLMTASDASLSMLYGRGKESFTAKEKKLIAIYCATFEAVFVPRRNVLFLNRLSLNQLAGLASRLWHAELSGFDRVFQTPREDFYAFVWVEALGFMGSKLLNHKRKTDGPLDWKRLVAAHKEEGIRSDKRLVASWALHHFRNERGGKPTAYPLKVFQHDSFSMRRTLLAFRTARELGGLLGHALYRAVMEGHATKEEVAMLFTQSFAGDSAYLLYRKWARRLDRFGLRVTDKRERL